MDSTGWLYLKNKTECFAFGRMEIEMRIGMGYDVHRLVEGRPLVIGGVTIPYALGLLGHSDADVLLHAIADALLGAAALGDIGKHFPDTDPAYKGISSLILLEKWENCWKKICSISKMLTRQSLHRHRKCVRILTRCAKTLQKRWEWI